MPGSPLSVTDNGGSLQGGFGLLWAWTVPRGLAEQTQVRNGLVAILQLVAHLAAAQSSDELAMSVHHGKSAAPNLPPLEHGRLGGSRGRR